MSDKEILDHLLNEQHYDKREKPPSSGKNLYSYGVLSYTDQLFSKTPLVYKIIFPLSDLIGFLFQI